MVTPAGSADTTMHSLELRGLSTDTKPEDVPNGSSFLEMDTGKVFMFDANSVLWLEL